MRQLFCLGPFLRSLLVLATGTGGLLALPARAQSPAADAPLIIGHAGSGFFTPLRPFNPLPPSSLRSINRALRHGADGIEIDVRLSQDSVPVLYHDNTLESMTTGQGCVSQTPAAALTRLRYRGGWPYDWFHQERIQTFATILARLQQQPQFPYLHLDLHEDDPCANDDVARNQALARGIERLLRHCQVPLGRVLIITNRPATLRYLGYLMPAVGLGLEVGDDYEASLADLRTLPQVGTVVLHKNAVTPARAEALHALGREVVVFGGRSARAVERVVSAEPDAYEVDNVRQLRSTLRRRQQEQQETMRR
ncbi:glycerophosphodiester phosphodiesterase [Hymenobacter rubripertinctus]|uniref:Glycerophosphodiester phosphodiesterase n=1 Tax=Hymenobacter rubripertinctus TaxID=2029981 RepID=A0A418R928_9BACT|nr:glycerophosphodiester phosphodiesterase family protein [Hymenobacter rubripertinctus]RIY13795.1 glycerophosphodiester phosphodiesterase [Hymenobacter rubripertinctus]